MMLALLFGLSSTALALPQQLTQQGRLLDSSGAAIEGLHVMHVRLYDDETAGSLQWDEVIPVTFSNGYYAAIIGANTSSNPLDDATLKSGPLYLELEIDANGPLSPRQPLTAAPFARLADVAESLDGGSVNATEISVGGNLVVDGNGSWIGPTIPTNWADISGIPADIADGDDDTLAGISCTTGEILGWSGTQWTCAADNGLTEAEVEAFVTNGPLDLDAATTIGGLPILTQGDGDTLSGLSCQSGDVAKYDSILGWICDVDIDTDTADWALLNGIPTDIADGDDMLSESDVEGYVTNGAIDLASGSLVDGEAIVAHDLCPAGESLTSDGVGWVCTNQTANFDQDSDGVVAWNDCDDFDASVGSLVDDRDCDMVASADDCNDYDPNSNTVADDADCDGYLTADDCDDTDPNSTGIAIDADCDGVLTANDCDDTDPSKSAAGDCELYAFSSHTFTNCGSEGRYGPSLSDCVNDYSSGGQAWSSDPNNLSMTMTGYQLWTVPNDGVYQIQAVGASSGEGLNYGGGYPGLGALISGEFNLVAGDKLQILVGQQGESVPLHPGAGGGTFVVMEDNTPLIIAGGGGAACRGDNTRSTTNATDSQSGVSSTCSGGTNGGGGSSCGQSYGSGGGGFYTDGENGPSSSTGGLAFVNGAEGGNCAATCGSNAGAGGFGGGGGTYHDIYGGGGGGYSGGGGGQYCYGGGGGGSYNIGSNQTSSTGFNLGHGYVVITPL